MCQINKAACELFGMGSERDILHAPVSRLFDDYDFVTVIAEELPLLQKQAYLADYGLYLEQTFLYEEQNKLIICIMKDITGSKKAHDRSMKSKISAANMLTILWKSSLESCMRSRRCWGKQLRKRSLPLRS